MRILWTFLVVAVLAAAFGQATPAQAASTPLSAQQQAHIERIERYFGDLKAMAAHFLQVSSNGRLARGRFYLWRPGRMRFEYDPPSPILIVSDGKWVSYTDNELEQTTLVPLSRTPLAVLVKDPISLATSTEILAVEQAAGILRVAFQMPDDPDAGILKLAFTQQPFELKQWTVTDAQGTEVRVTLINAIRGERFDQDLFVVQHPKDSVPTER